VAPVASIAHTKKPAARAGFSSSFNCSYQPR
jgi:hypothetical protein